MPQVQAEADQSRRHAAHAVLEPRRDASCVSRCRISAAASSPNSGCSSGSKPLRRLAPSVEPWYVPIASSRERDAEAEPSVAARRGRIDDRRARRVRDDELADDRADDELVEVAEHEPLRAAASAAGATTT